MGTFLQDVRFALRNLRRSPAVPLAAIATLALGIGATTAIFSTVNAALLRPLPYPHAEDLYSLRTTLTDGRVTTGMVAGSEIVRLNDPSLSIERAAGMQQFDATLLREDGTPANAVVYGVSEGFFELFGLPMTLGGFKPEQLATEGPPPVVISHRIWREMFQSDPGIVGKPMRFAEVTTSIAGVAPRDFDTPHNCDFWFGVRLNPQDVNHSFEGFMRVRRGTTMARAEAELAVVMAGLARDFPASARARAYVVRPIVAQIVGDLGPILIVVLSATGLLLVLACVNVTNLLLARGAARAREMAIRVALGAGRGRIVRQLLTESVILATAGSIVGLLVAALGVRLLMSVGAAKLPRLDAVPFDATVLLFALAALFVSGIFVGFAPALRLARTDVKTLMNESGRSASGGAGTARWLGVMTVAEIALAITLVAGAGWLIRSFANLRMIDPGFSADQRLLFDLTMQGPKFNGPAAITASLGDLFGRLRALPGVAAAGATSSFPLRNSQENSLLLQIQGKPFNAASPMGSRQRFVTSGFFNAAGIRVVAGRDIDASDRPDGARVIVVNRTFVTRYLDGRDPIGTRVSYGYPTVNPNSESAIVGVVDDVRQKTLVEVPEPAFYSPVGQGFARRLTIVVHTKSADTAPLQAAIRDEMRRFDPAIAVDFQAVPELVSSTLRRQELGMTLMLLFGAVAVALATVGIYGVVAYAAAQRRGEVATRLALGASSANVFWLVLKQGCILAAIGTAIGLTVAYFAGRVVANNIYAVRAADPVILGVATMLVASIAIVATMIPAFRAARLDPARVLRAD
jgi:putative ABC transport system permease protein